MKMSREHDTPFIAQTREIIPPAEGWQEHTLYLVDVAYRPTNLTHKAFFHVGFLSNGQPAAYSEIWCNTYDHAYKFRDAWYLRAVRVLYKE